MEEIKLTKGDSLNFIFEIEETRQDLESCFFTCVKNKSDTNYVFIKTLNNGIKKIKTTGNSIVYSVRVAPEDTKNLEGTEYFAELKIKIDNDVFTPFQVILKFIDSIYKGVV